MGLFSSSQSCVGPTKSQQNRNQSTAIVLLRRGRSGLSPAFCLVPVSVHFMMHFMMPESWPLLQRQSGLLR
jgi:hypothetical protein